MGKHALLFLLASMILLGRPTKGQKTDAQALLAFKASLGSGGALSNWTEGSDPCAGWVGITCINGRVTEIFLPNVSLTGPVPTAAVLPSELDTLIMDNNKVQGTIPDGWTLPSSLRFARLSANQLQGTLPLFEFPPALEVLELHENQLTGTIPSNWTFPSGFQSLNLVLNQLTGTLPAYDQDFDVLVVPGNVPGLCGEIPDRPRYVNWTWTENQTLPTLTSLPSCPSPPPFSSKAPYAPEPAAASSPAATSSPAPSPAEATPSSSSSSNTGVVVGAVVGAVAVLVLSAVLVWWFWHRRKQQSANGLDGSAKPAKEAAGDAEKGLGSLQDIHPKADELPQKHVDSAMEAPSDRTLQSSQLMSSDPLLASIMTLIHGASVSSSGRTGSGAVDAGSMAPAGRAASVGSQGQARRLTGLDVNRIWSIKFEDLQLECLIGQGSFGRVYLGCWRETEVAVKVLLDMTNPDLAAAAEMALSPSNPVLSHLEEEATLLASFRHPNVVGFLGICDRPPCLLSEYCQRGSLFDIIRQARASPELQKKLSWDRRLQIALGAAKGMLYLHSNEPALVHRDLKSPNILVTQNWEAKVSDFNLSRLMEGEASVASSLAANNPRWLAPEVLLGERPSFASDVFSFGTVLWELLTLEIPFATQTNTWELARFLINGGRLEIPPPEELKGGRFAGLDAYVSLIQQCWDPVPQSRPSFGQIVIELRGLKST